MTDASGSWSLIKLNQEVKTKPKSTVSLGPLKLALALFLQFTLQSGSSAITF